MTIVATMLASKQASKHNSALFSCQAENCKYQKAYSVQFTTDEKRLLMFETLLKIN